MLLWDITHDMDAVERDDPIQQLAFFHSSAWRRADFRDNTRNRRTNDDAFARVSAALTSAAQIEVLELLLRDLDARRRSLMRGLRFGQSALRDGPGGRQPFDPCEILLRQAKGGLRL